MDVSLRDNISGTIVTAAVIYLLYRFLQWIRTIVSRFKFYNSLPGESDFSFITGNLHLFPVDEERRLEYELSLTHRFPKMYRVWFGPLVPSIQVCHPETVKAVLKTSAPKPYGMGSVFEFFRPWLGDGILIAKGATWERSRRLITPTFHFNILRPYVDIYNVAVDTLLCKIDSYAASGKSFDLFKVIKPCTLEILLRCCMTCEDDIQNARNDHPYLKAVEELTELVICRLRQPLHHIQWLYDRTQNGRRFKQLTDYVHNVSATVIAARQKTLADEGTPSTMGTPGTRYPDFLDILLKARDEDGVGMTTGEIQNEVDTILFEGHDTTASAISWTLYSLAQHADYRRRVQTELDGVLNDRDSVTWGDLPTLEYLTLCLKESLRYHSPVPFIARQTEDVVNIGGVTLPTGTIVAVSIYNLHRHPDIWEEPDVFRPDRFHPDNMAKIDPFSFVPFSAGPRNCIGQNFAMNELKVVIGRILQRFDLVPDPSHAARHQAAVVMRAVEGLWVFASRR
ncbi:cytochrome P450 4F6-like [Haliotis cracherodii]|uniref:cytochrome P450 4F6-like n=1 Tax=Haliotis cracherodii TaxID=6455 RepID=UPI0039E900A7